jgi:AAA15 family ATPase/GTPase
MIKSVFVQNYRSINEGQTLSFVKSLRKKAERPHYRKVGPVELACASVIYGANASGKSNFLMAIAALQKTILFSSDNKPSQPIREYEPFRLQRGQDTKPVCFEVEFIAADIAYTYTVHFTQNQIEFEKLSFFPNGRRSLLFERSSKGEMLFGDHFKGEKKVIQRLVLPNQLYLSKGAENNSESCLAVYQFFKESLFTVPVYSTPRSYLGEVFSRRLALEPDSSFALKYSALIRALDTGIQQVFSQETGLVNGRFAAARFSAPTHKGLYEIKTQHEYYDENQQSIGFEEFDINDESSGTQSLFYLGGLILDTLEKGSVLVVDEFDTSLHPLVTSYLIRLFANPLSNPKGAQLLFATHDVTLLDEELFNRDQIWFTEKSERGGTELVRCSDIEGLRSDAPIGKWYLSGRLGGTAIIDDADLVTLWQKELGE